MIIEDLQSILINIEQERDLEQILQRIVNGLAAQPGIALARVWLRAPGDRCDRDCPALPECPNHDECLHLAASAGRSMAEPEEQWTQTDGFFSRFPLNIRKIGLIAGHGEPVLIEDMSVDNHWVSRPEWVEQEGIVSMAGNPLIFRGEVMGVLGLFSRERLTPADAEWLHLFADHAAVAISNARAFEAVRVSRDDLAKENLALREQIRAVQGFGEIVGRSRALQKILDQIRLVAPTDASVLILGESGTGKDLVAQAIHDHSQRCEHPLVKVNCGAIPKDLFESEFFGHIKGAFTGAVQDRDGRFELADGGTLFLDEVGEIPLNLQSKLLRVLQEGRFERIGDARTRQVDVRIIAATNRDLEDAAGFRRDLYYRLSVFPIAVPPLRQRKEDIPLLAQHFVRQSELRLNCPPVNLTQHDLMQLQAYDWPGNVRELQNVIERAVIMARNGTFELDLDGNAATPQLTITHGDREFLTQAELDDLERRNLETVLALTEWKVSGPGGAAELLGVKPTTLYSRIKKMGLSRDER